NAGVWVGSAVDRNQGTPQTLGPHLKAWRIIVRGDPEDAAEAAHLSGPGVRPVERGDPGVSMATFIKLAGVVGMDQFLVEAIDPLNHDLGQARAHMLNRKRAPRS